MRSRPAPARRVHRAVAIAAIAIATAAGLGGCGVRTDSSPRDIPADRQRELDNPAAPEDATPSGGSLVYLVRESTAGDTTLQAVRRRVPTNQAAVMEALLAGPTSTEQAERLSTAIPAGTRLLGTEFVGPRTLGIDLSDEILTASGDALIEAVAQIVLTTSEIDNVDLVELFVEGRRQQWPRGDGVVVSTPLSVYDFPGLVASTQPDYPPLPSPQT